MNPAATKRIAEKTRKRFVRVWLKNVARRKKRPVLQWAKEVRKMRGGPIAGNRVIPFTTELCPHVEDQMAACDDPRVNMIVIWSAVRDMKTATALCAIGRTVTDDPGGVYSVHPTADDADKFSENDLETMIELALEDYFVAKKSRDSGRTKDFKKFRGGFIRIVSAGATTAFRGSTVKVLHLPEADALEPESIVKAFGRTTGISDAIKIMESTCTIAPTFDPTTGKKEYHSTIHKYFEKGDQRKWFVECANPDCGHLQILKYSHFRFPPGEMDKTKCYCEKCDYGHNEAEWFRMCQKGKWYPTAALTEDQVQDIEHTYKLAKAPQPEVRSYWRNGFNSLLDTEKGYATKLHEFVAQGESAKASPEDLKTWTNEKAAELWDPIAIGEDSPDWKPLQERAEPYATTESLTVPTGALILTGGGDVHPDRIEWTWLGWGRGETCWIIDHVVILGDIRDHSKSGPWDKFAIELQRQFVHEAGGTIGLESGLIDAGYGWDDVLKFLQTKAALGKLRACRGSTQYPAPVVDSYGKLVTGRAGQGTLFGHFVGTDAIKDTLYSRLRLIPTPDGLPDGWLHFGQNLPEEFFIQFTAEQVEIVLVQGREERRYRKKKIRASSRNTRNETLDTWVYGYASFRRRQNWQWDDLERERMRTNEKEEEPVNDSSSYVPPMPSLGGGFGTGWSV